MTKQMNLGGTFTLPGHSMTLNRMGYGAMQLAGPQVWGPPRDVDGAIAVLREAVIRQAPSGESQRCSAANTFRNDR
jgi:pyridoxine 4-dehydrogenase